MPRRRAGDEFRACDVTDAASVRAPVRRAGAGRCAGELRRACRGQYAGWRRCVMARDRRIEPARHVLLLQGGAAAVAGRQRTHREYRVGAGASRRRRPDRLLRGEARRGGLHPRAGPGAGAPRHHGERCLSRAGWTPRWRGSVSANWASRRKLAAAGVPTGHITTPAEVADAVAWLLRPEVRSITGHALPIEGGGLAAP